MDFWAQHKDFILKILAGVGVFLVALIARSITYGDELEKAQAANARLSQTIQGTRIAKRTEIRALAEDADRLHRNSKAIVGQIGWDLGDDRLEQRLLERILRYMRTYANRGEEDVRRRADYFRAALNEDLNGGFGQLRLQVRQDLVDEAKERGIRVDREQEGVGFDAVTDIQPSELRQYLLQLELIARVARAAIDARVDAIEDIRITTGSGRREEVIPGANPAFIQEYGVSVTVTGGQDAIRTILDRLEEAPRPAIVGIRAERVKRPENHMKFTIDLLATAANPEVPFKEQEQQ